jgi:hypothetical protein
VEITDNRFIGGTAPEERGPFLGDLPLFAGNEFEGLRLTPRGGISLLSPENDIVRPVFEQVVVQAGEPIAAYMRTGVYAHGQELLVIGGGDTAAVTLRLDSERVIKAGTVLHLRYDADAESWGYVSGHQRGVLTVTFEGNGGNTQGADIYIRNVVQGMGIGDFPLFTKEGYRFMGWNTEPGGNGEEVTSSCFIDAETTLYAMWLAW